MIKSISIVIPAYNEMDRIAPTLKAVFDYLVKNAERFEIIVVDDGSSDKTAEIVSGLAAEKDPIRLLRREENRGKGFSVRRGMLEATGDLILISDADLSTPIEEVEKLLPWIGKGFDIVIGSRALRESKIEKKQPWYRQSMGKVFNALVRTLVFGGFHDTQCGFKLFTSKAARDLFSVMKIKGFAFDVEALFLAKKMGYGIKEVPVRWLNSPLSKVRVLRDSSGMFLDLLKIRLFSRPGRKTGRGA